MATVNEYKHSLQLLRQEVSERNTSLGVVEEYVDGIATEAADAAVLLLLADDKLTDIEGILADDGLDDTEKVAAIGVVFEGGE